MSYECVHDIGLDHKVAEKLGGTRFDGNGD